MELRTLVCAGLSRAQVANRTSAEARGCNVHKRLLCTLFMHERGQARLTKLTLSTQPPA
jgi:hypothetical protein